MAGHRQGPSVAGALVVAMTIGLIVPAHPAEARPDRITHSAASKAGTVPLPSGVTCPAPEEFPPGDEGFHGYQEVLCDIYEVEAAHPDIVEVTPSVGLSFQGRDIPLVKISDNVHLADDGNEPEVLFDGLHHALEHLSGEMALSVIHLLVDGYGSDPRITDLVDTRVIWVIPVVNPDGYVYELGGPPEDPYRGWRKNRQPNGPPGSGIPRGTDLNRNYAFHWGGPGSSSDPGAWNYRGAAPFSAPEAAVMRDFVRSRVVDGLQRIRTHITFHTFGEEIYWPFGHTLTDLVPAMTVLDHDVFAAMATAMGATNGYAAIQASDRYLHSGSMIDWTYAEQRIFGFTFELFPPLDEPGEPTPDEIIERETIRNHEAVLYLIEHADCPYRSIGRAASHCGPLFDDLEAERGWTVDPAATDPATSGVWARGNPQPTASSGPKQLGDAWSGRAALVTGLASGGCAECNDVDGGMTSVRSRAITLPAGGSPTLRLRSFLGHGADADAGDGLRVAVLEGPTRTVVIQRLATPGIDVDAAWQTATADLGAWAGRTIRIQLEANDGGAPSLVEVGVDEVRITAH